MQAVCYRFGGLFQAVRRLEALGRNCFDNRQRILHPMMKFTDDDLL
jgi:hypothetical protein